MPKNIGDNEEEKLLNELADVATEFQSIKDELETLSMPLKPDTNSIDQQLITADQNLKGLDAFEDEVSGELEVLLVKSAGAIASSEDVVATIEEMIPDDIN